VAFDEYSSTQKVKAEQIEEGRSVITPNGPMAAHPGQWEVRYPDGNVQVVDDDQFQTAFGSGQEKEAEVTPTDVTPQPEMPPEEPEEESEDETTEPAPKKSPQAPPKPA
jgi:hypothetical protein